MLKDNNTALADAQIDLLLKAIRNQDAGAILPLFAANAVAIMPDIENDIEVLLSYCGGQMGQYDNWGGPYVESAQEYGNRKTAIFGTYDVKANNDATYRFAFQYVSHDTAEPQNVGLWSLCVRIEMDDEELQFAYWSDALYIPGIHIETDSKLILSDG